MWTSTRDLFTPGLDLSEGQVIYMSGEASRVPSFEGIDGQGLVWNGIIRLHSFVGAACKLVGASFRSRSLPSDEVET
jgi:hypothetical protein